MNKNTIATSAHHEKHRFEVETQMRITAPLGYEWDDFSDDRNFDPGGFTHDNFDAERFTDEMIGVSERHSNVPCQEALFRRKLSNHQGIEQNCLSECCHQHRVYMRIRTHGKNFLFAGIVRAYSFSGQYALLKFRNWLRSVTF